MAALGELFDTLVVFESYPVDSTALHDLAQGLRVRNVGGFDVTHYPLCLAAVPGARLRLNLQYRPDLFEAAFVGALGRRLARLLETIALSLDRRVAAIDLLDARERHQILREWNDTAKPIPQTT